MSAYIPSKADQAQRLRSHTDGTSPRDYDHAVGRFVRGTPDKPSCWVGAILSASSFDVEPLWVCGHQHADRWAATDCAKEELARGQAALKSAAP